VTRPTPLSDLLERALLRELLRTWEHLDALHFRGAMRPPAIDLADLDGVLARWSPETRTICFGRRLVVEQPWAVVVEVLRHEMAHQYVSEVLKVRDETAHGPAFRKVCAERGIDPAANGIPTAALDEDDPRTKVLRRVQKLLALGESPNANEAAAAMRRAQRLMLEHNLSPGHRAATYGFLQLGAPALRVPAHHRILAGILADSFFVRAIWVPGWIPRKARRGRVLEITGTPSNLATAEYVYTYVLRTAERLWLEDLAPAAEKGRFLLGVMLGFRDKLDAQRRQDAEEGLVWVGDAALQDFVGLRHPRLRSSRAVTFHETDAWHRGRAAGRSIELRAGVTERAEGRRKLIGP
jgi:hypothetical protein